MSVAGVKTRTSDSQERNWNLSSLPNYVVLIILVIFALVPLYGTRAKITRMISTT